MRNSHRKEQENLLRNHRLPRRFTDEAIFNFLSDLDHPYSLAIWLLYDNKEHNQLVARGINPMDFNEPEDFRDAYIATEFLSKANFLEPDVSREDAAFSKFYQYEEQCKSTNNRFRDLSLDPSYNGANVWLLNATVRKIEQVLGDFSAEEIVEGANWGPGVSTVVNGEHVSAINKFQSETGITGGLYSLVGKWFPLAYPHWWQHRTPNGESSFTRELGNKIVTVPKNSKTDRVIAIEPGINLWFQKSIGSAIRRRLLRAGIDLTDQTRNQQLACSGARTGRLATVDFSSASDSISTLVVWELLPPRWRALMDACRSPVGFHKDRAIHWEKYSSMGNGFTFELESLIFYAAALASREYKGCDGEVSVYGDDVIVPVECYDLFSSFSRFLGFTVNPKKSFSSGYFRESCGSHYFGDTDCKPIYLKERILNVQAVFKLANRIRDLSHRIRHYNGCDRRFRRSWLHLYRRVPRTLQFKVSAGYGDSGFVVNFDESCPAIKAKGGFEGFLTEAVIETGVTQSVEYTGLLLARYWANKSNRCSSSIMPGLQSQNMIGCRARRTWSFGSISSGEAYGNNYTLRGRTKLSVKRLLVPQWYNLGPWC